jgi:hypothetical protein
MNTVGALFRQLNTTPPSSPPLSSPNIKNLPRVLLLDMDGTMIGRINPQVCEYEILSTFQKGKLKAMKQELAAKLRQGVLRPHLAWFCALAKSGRLPDLELFVYTASDDRWAHFLVPCIEEAIGFRFNRPLFTRKHCILVGAEYRKSLAGVAPLIFKRLRPRYHGLESAKGVEDRMALVDNNHGVLLHPHLEGGRIVRCFTFNAAYWYDVLARMDANFLERNYERVVPFLAKFGMYPTDVRPSDIRSFRHFTYLYYSKMTDNVKGEWRNEKEDGRDVMWAALGEALVRISETHSPHDEVVRHMQSALLTVNSAHDAFSPSEFRRSGGGSPLHGDKKDKEKNKNKDKNKHKTERSGHDRREQRSGHLKIKDFSSSSSSSSSRVKGGVNKM